jgi:large subunit ribosomal protein L15e
MKKFSQEFTIQLRKEPSINRLKRPSRPKKARMLGYKANKEYIIVRVKIRKGGRKRRQVHRGRKPSKSGIRGFSPKKSLRLISEERANKKHPNLEVLNSYYVAEDGKHKWYEVILTKLPKKGRVYRGLTSAGKRVRGLLHKGKKKNH